MKPVLLGQGLRFLRDVARTRIGLRPQSPFVVGLTINTICNLRCSYCFIGREAEHFPEGFAKQGMPGDEIKKLLTNVRKDTGLLILTGGEPFLHKDLEEILRFAKEDLRFVNISVATNAMFLRKRSSALKYIDRLGISYDFTRARQYPKEMGKMLESLKELKAERILPPVHFTMTILKSEDLAPFDDFANYCREQGFRIWVQPEREHGDFDEWDWFIGTLESLVGRFGKKLFLNDLGFVRNFRDGTAPHGCLPELRLHVQEDGNLCFPCNKLEHLYKGGSVLDATPMERWAEATAEAGTFPNSSCGKCGFTCYFETGGLYRRPIQFAKKAAGHMLSD